MGWLKLWRDERRLQVLQRQYYSSRTKDDAVIAEYLKRLANIRERYLQLRWGGQLHEQAVRIHLGSGGHRIDGWLNIDLVLDSSVDMIADLTVSLPFKTECVDLLHSEDFIEHVDRLAADGILAECFRVLSPGGVMRIVTPDLRAITRRVYIDQEAAHLQWATRELNATTPCEAFNALLRMDGDHRFVYDHQELTRAMQAVGFKVRTVSYNRSPEPELRFLDLRNFGLSLYLEGTKQ